MNFPVERVRKCLSSNPWKMAALPEEFDKFSLSAVDDLQVEIEDFLYFVRFDEMEELKEYLSKRPDWSVNVADPNSGNTALHYSAANGLVEMLDLLLTFNPNVNIKNQLGNTPLHWACMNGNLEIFQKLCENGADPFLENDAGRNCIEEAVFYGHEKIVQYAINKYQQ